MFEKRGAFQSFPLETVENTTYNTLSGRAARRRGNAMTFSSCVFGSLSPILGYDNRRRNDDDNNVRTRDIYNGNLYANNGTVVVTVKSLRVIIIIYFLTSPRQPPRNERQ